MTREQILAELSSVKQQIRKKKGDIQDFTRVLPQMRRDDARELRDMRKNHTPPQYVCTDRERKQEASIAGFRAELEQLYSRKNELESSLRSLSDQNRMVGAIKWFNPDPAKNFGFIVVDGQPDVFVHGSSFKDTGTPQEGDKVSFKRLKGDKGFRAVDVRYVSE